MLRFYYVKKEYVEFLRQYDSKVPALNYDSHNKFFCGVVLSVNGKKYYAPISHDIRKQQTSVLIYDRERAISSIKFAFMIPVPDDVLSPLNFSEIALADPKYADLLRAEYSYCSRIIDQIVKKAGSVYRIGCTETHRLYHVCCKFEELEKGMDEYIKASMP